MIDDSWPWKCDLAKMAEGLARRTTQRRWSEASFARVERDLFTAAYATRKLIEGRKLSDEVESMSLAATAFRPKTRVCDIFNRHRIDELYDLNEASSVQMKLQEFCNQLIHSFVFTPEYEPGVGLRGFFVASDRERVRRIFYFAIGGVVEAFRGVAADDIVWSVARSSSMGAERIVIRKSNRPPLEAEIAELELPREFVGDDPPSAA